MVKDSNIYWYKKNISFFAYSENCDIFSGQTLYLKQFL